MPATRRAPAAVEKFAGDNSGKVRVRYINKGEKLAITVTLVTLAG
jgi:hypothetical protein